LEQEVTETVQAPHLQLALEQSDATGIHGTRITPAVEVRLAPVVHVYAPGTKGYKLIKPLPDPIPQLQFQPVVYPPSKTLYSPAIKGQVPVVEGPVHISQDIQVALGAEFWGSLGKDGKTFTITGKVEHQASTRPLATCRPRSPSNGNCSCFCWTACMPPWSFGTNKRPCAARPRLVHLLDFTAGEKILVVISNVVCGVRNLSFLVFVPKRDS
jgi:hypothetical protein